MFFSVCLFVLFVFHVAIKFKCYDVLIDRGSVDSHFFEYAVRMLRLTPLFVSYSAFDLPLLVTLRGLCV